MISIIHNPQILILDEPTSGLDPGQILQVRRLIQECERKRTVILSTHILSEIEQISQRVIIMKSGSLVADNNIQALVRREGRPPRTLEEVFLQLTAEEK